MIGKISEKKALELLQDLYCEDIGSWLPIKTSNFIHEIEHGLMNGDGIYSGLFLKFHYFYHPKTKKKNYILSVYRKTMYGNERIYQLDVIQQPKAIKDDHSRPHEHLGDARYAGTKEWLNWSFEDALKHFITKTCITISGKVDSPDEFKLK